jgi:hypothetical protein
VLLTPRSSPCCAAIRERKFFGPRLDCRSWPGESWARQDIHSDLIRLIAPPALPGQAISAAHKRMNFPSFPGPRSLLAGVDVLHAVSLIFETRPIHAHERRPAAIHALTLVRGHVRGYGVTGSRTDLEAWPAL